MSPVRKANGRILRREPWFSDLTGLVSGTGAPCVKLRTRAANATYSSPVVLCGTGLPLFTIRGSEEHRLHVAGAHPRWRSRDHLCGRSERSACSTSWALGKRALGKRALGKRALGKRALGRLALGKPELGIRQPHRAGMNRRSAPQQAVPMHRLLRRAGLRPVGAQGLPSASSTSCALAGGSKHSANAAFSALIALAWAACFRSARRRAGRLDTGARRRP